MSPAPGERARRIRRWGPAAHRVVGAPTPSDRPPARIGTPSSWSAEWAGIAAIAAGLALLPAALPLVLLQSPAGWSAGWPLVQVAGGTLAAGAVGAALGPIGRGLTLGAARWRLLVLVPGLPTGCAVGAAGGIGYRLVGLAAGVVEVYPLGSLAFVSISSCALQLTPATLAYGMLRLRGSFWLTRAGVVLAALVLLGPGSAVAAGATWFFAQVAADRAPPAFHFEPCAPAPPGGVCPPGCFQECVPSCDVCTDCVPGLGACVRRVEGPPP